MDIFESLKKRGLIKQTVFEDDLKKILREKSVSFYVGIDPTADSLHIGHFATILMAKRLQLAGHKPYLLIGGGTAMIGDPTGRTDMRQMLTTEQINNNIKKIEVQLKKYFDFSKDNKAVIVNNADWLLKLNYVNFIRDIGANLSVNKMLTYDCYKNRWEKGLTFLEFNYMPMQGYDFLHLFTTYNVVLQVGGDDQWSNILAGEDLVRRKTGKPVFALTFPLLTKADGGKMGKTSGGAVWLDAEKTDPYVMFQYFRDIDDSMVESTMKMLTLLSVEEIEELTKYHDERMNNAKERLAYEVVKLVHSQSVADEMLSKARASFSNNAEEMLSKSLVVEPNEKIVDILLKSNLVESKSEARRLILANAIKVNGRTISNIEDTLTPDEFSSKNFILHKGKKNHLKIEIVG